MPTNKGTHNAPEVSTYYHMHFIDRMEVHRDLIIFPGSDDKSEASCVLLTETAFLPFLYSLGNNHANNRGSQNSLREWKRHRMCSYDGGF